MQELNAKTVKRKEAHEGIKIRSFMTVRVVTIAHKCLLIGTSHTYGG